MVIFVDAKVEPELSLPFCTGETRPSKEIPQDSAPGRFSGLELIDI